MKLNKKVKPAMFANPNSIKLFIGVLLSSEKLLSVKSIFVWYPVQCFAKITDHFERNGCTFYLRYNFALMDW